MSSLRRGHANLLCIVPILSDDQKVSELIHITFGRSLGFSVKTFQEAILTNATLIAAMVERGKENENSKHSAAGTRTRVSWVRAKYPNQLDYSG